MGNNIDNILTISSITMLIMYNAANMHNLQLKHHTTIRVGPIDDAIAHRRWLTDITMLSWHCDSPSLNQHTQC